MLLKTQNSTNIIKTHRKELDLLADALLKYETLDSEDVKCIIKGDVKSVHQKNSANTLLRISNTADKRPIKRLGNGTATEDVGGSNEGDVLV